MSIYYINNSVINLATIEHLLSTNQKLALSDESREAIIRGRNYLDKKLDESSEPVYGVNTGFGALCNKKISPDHISELQRNLVMSHACGTGEEAPSEIVKLMLLLKIRSLSYGKSGVTINLIERLMLFFNEDVLPVVYQQGSLGASGDLSPLAHLSLPLIGLGEVYFKGKRMKSAEALQQLEIQPIELKSKEGLALLNGTQFMSAYGVMLCLKSRRISEIADLVTAISLDAYDGRIEAFHEIVHKVRPHAGQAECAKRIRKNLEGSSLINRPKEHVQDPYSFRCVPQVHGATYDTIEYVCKVMETEINSVTDNPTIFPEEDMIISAGNFHGQPLALALDFLAIALAELGSISERRIFKLISGQRGLPHFLTANPGLNSGFMIPQYTAASIVSQNKQLCHPASVDSIDSSQGQEDHVSMGANAATKTLRVFENLQRVISIELMNAAQAMDFRKPATSSPLIESFLSDFRKKVRFMENDSVMYELIDESIQFIKNRTEITNR